MTIGAGALFKESARSNFLRISGQRYDSMQARMTRKNLPALPFTKAEFRDWLLIQLGSNQDGFAQCRYCRNYFGIEECAVDHAVPLARGGSAGLDNLELPCGRCNHRKGGLTPDEYLALLGFLEARIPLGRLDVLERLEKAVQLAAGQRFNQGIIGELRKSGHWQQAQKKRREKRNGSRAGKI